MGSREKEVRADLERWVAAKRESEDLGYRTVGGLMEGLITVQLPGTQPEREALQLPTAH